MIKHSTEGNDLSPFHIISCLFSKYEFTWEIIYSENPFTILVLVLDTDAFPPASDTRNNYCF